MTNYEFLSIVTERENADAYVGFFARHSVEHILVSLCEGTASASTLDLFGLKPTEKIGIEAIVRGEDVPDLIRDLKVSMNIEAVGNGIAVFIPVDGIGGVSSKRYFTGELNSERKFETMSENSKNVLIITVVNKGFSDVVMEAAKSAGATGGTVLHAHGTGTEMAKFLGITISEEKDTVQIVASRESRDAILRAVMEKAGNATPAHGIAYSLPIDAVVGIKALED